MIRILLIDDHALVRDGVGRLLELQPDMRVVGAFSDGHAAVAFAAGEEPDLAIVDIAMPSISGIDVIRRLREVAPDTHVLVLSMHSNAEHVHQAFLAGALGYVAKESAGLVLVEAVRAVQAGRRFLSESIGADALQRYLEAPGRRDPMEQLSPREREVLRRTVEGCTIAETAAQLGVSPKTVETYRSRIMTKLAIGDLPGLVKFAIRYGITSVD